MKQIFIFILLVLSTYLKAQSIQEIDSLLLVAYENDQKVRTESMILMNKLNSTGANDVPVSVIDSLMLLQEQTQAIDKENQILVTSILKKGLPEGLSQQSYKTIWLIVGKHSVNHVFLSPTSIINFTSKKQSYDDTRRSSRDNELLQRAQSDL